MNLAEALEKQTSYTHTENGALAFNKTTSKVLDFFALAGALRNDEERALHLFNAAFDENPYLAVKALFYARDVRGGLGERKIPKLLLNHLAQEHPEWVEANIELIPYFGRWDDLLVLLDTPVEDKMFSLLRATLKNDVKASKSGKPFSLLAKWLPTPNSGSKNTASIGRRVAKGIIANKSEYIQYCKTLASLRKQLALPEIAMAAKRYEDIEYSKIASRAMLFHKDAFKKNDAERFDAYLESVKSGNAKMNTGSLVPYNIIHDVVRRDNVTDELQLMWDNLPNYIEGDETNILCMCDTSASMTWDGGRPYEVACGLGIYFAERNHGVFHNKFITFSTEPTFVDISAGGKRLAKKINIYRHANWAGSTDIGAAMKLILDAAVKGHVAPKDMPKALIIISDMEFNACSSKNNKTFIEKYKSKFEAKGYSLPDVIFWNVNSRNAVYHAQKNDCGVQLVSGENPSVFRQVIDNIGKNPYDSMVATLSQERYNVIINPEQMKAEETKKKNEEPKKKAVKRKVSSKKKAKKPVGGFDSLDWADALDEIIKK